MLRFFLTIPTVCTYVLRMFLFGTSSAQIPFFLKSPSLEYCAGYSLPRILKCFERALIIWYTSNALWLSKWTESFSTLCGCAYCFWYWWLRSLAPPLSSSPPCLSQYLLRLSSPASSSCTRIAANASKLRSPDNAVDGVGRGLFVVDSGSSPSCIVLEDECVCGQKLMPLWKLELALCRSQKIHTLEQ